MKKSITTIAILLLSLNLFSQGNKEIYYQKMGETLGQFASCKTNEDFNKLSNQFSMIAQVENKEWMPLYYAANCKIIMSFNEKEDKIKKEAYLDEAEKMFAKMFEITTVEHEIFALEALFNTARLVVDPITRGQEFTIKSNKSASQALTLNANSPRAKYVMLSNKIGFAQFFGKETTQECLEANELLSNWDEYNKSKNPLAPVWGKELVEAIVLSCK